MDTPPTSDETLTSLIRLGFSQYEGQAYCALLQHSPMNGHEVSKASGVPPSKIYETLQRLGAKGAVLVHRSEPVRYAATPYRTVLESLRRRFEADLTTVEKGLHALPGARDTGLTWSLRQRDAVLSAATDAVNGAQHGVFAALWDEELEELAPCLEAASRRGLEVHVAVYGRRVLQGPHCYDLTLCGESAVERLGGRRLSAVVADGRGSVIAEFRADGSVEAILTDSPLVSLLAVEYIKEDVMGRILINELGEERYQRLRRQSEDMRAMLRSVEEDTTSLRKRRPTQQRGPATKT
jgi:sugar-specific transcriptional regulator TrmB